MDIGRIEEVAVTNKNSREYASLYEFLLTAFVETNATCRGEITYAEFNKAFETLVADSDSQDQEALYMHGDGGYMHESHHPGHCCQDLEPTRDIRIPTGGNVLSDAMDVFLKTMDNSIDYWAEEIRADLQLANDFNCIGVSQDNSQCMTHRLPIPSLSTALSLVYRHSPTASSRASRLV